VEVVVRFDREDANSEHAPTASTASATERLKTTVEQQVRAVVEEAMARAVAIEDRALAEASQMKQESQVKVDAIIRESQERAGHVLSSALLRAEAMRDATETLQTELAKVIGSFRDEIEVLTSELKGAKDGLMAPPGAVPTPEHVAQEPAAIQPEPAHEPEPAVQQPVTAQSALSLEPAAEPNHAEPRAVPAPLATAEAPAAPAPRPPVVSASASPASDVRARDIDEIYAPEAPVSDGQVKRRRRGLRRRR
jgi:hypothetical protein